MTIAAGRPTEPSPNVSVTVHQGMLKLRVKIAAVLSVLLLALSSAGGWVYHKQNANEGKFNAFDNRISRLEERQHSSEREIFYAREDIRWHMRSSGVTATTPPPVPPTPTTRPGGNP